MYPYFDFSLQTLKKASPVMDKWFNENNIGLFDYDNCQYASNVETVLEPHFEWVAQKYKALAIVECHPFFHNEERYVYVTGMIKEIATKLNLPLVWLTADYKLWNNSYSNRSFFPSWYFILRNHANNFRYDQWDFNKSRNYNFSCCNMANLRYEKVYNYIECFRRKRDDWLLTIYNHPHASISDTNVTDVGISKLDQIEIWNTEIKNNIPMYVPDLLNNSEGNSAMSTIFNGHTDAYCNLVMEHSMEIEILSEKSFKPFIAQQIPIYLAQTGAAEMMTELGFDLFYDFIDHTQYDNIGLKCGRFPETFTSRIDKVHQLIDNLYTTDFTGFINRPDIIERKLKNKEYFYSDAIDYMCIEKYKDIFPK